MHVDARSTWTWFCSQVLLQDWVLWSEAPDLEELHSSSPPSHLQLLLEPQEPAGCSPQLVVRFQVRGCGQQAWLCSVGGAKPFASVLLWWSWDTSRLWLVSWLHEDHQTVPDSHLFLLLLLPLLRVASVSRGNRPCQL